MTNAICQCSANVFCIIILIDSFSSQVTDGFDGCIRKLDISFTDVAGLNFNFE